MKKDLLFCPAKEALEPVLFVLSINLTVGEALELIRNRQPGDKNVMYFYVVDDRNSLLGVVKTRDLLTKKLDAPITSVIQTKLHVIQSFQTLYDALMLMQKYHLLAIPVLEKGKLLGVVDVSTYFEEAVQLDSAKKRKEIFQTLGIIVDERKTLTLGYKYRTRMPWLICNVVGGLICAWISHLFAFLLLKIIMLAMFIPLVLSLSESISMQAMSQSFFEIEKRHRFTNSLARYLVGEGKLFILLSFTCALLVGFISLFWEGGIWASFSIGISIFCAINVSSVLGASIPLVLHELKLDPKIASGPVVLMLADVLTTLIYFSFGFWLLLD